MFDGNIIKTIILTIGLVIIAVLALARVDSYLRIQAVNNCSKVSQYSQTNEDGSEVRYPVEDIMKRCLQEAGY